MTTNADRPQPPPGGLGTLLRKGALDSLLQVAATALVRLGLVVAVLVIAPFVSLEELGRFDLFVVGSSFALLAVTLGMDSGLALAARSPSQAGRRALLIVALAMLLALAVLWGLGGLALWWVTSSLSPTSWGVPPETSKTWAFAGLTLIYGTLNGALVLIFNWFRWQGRAVTASLILIAANIVGFASAALAFALTRQIDSFVIGLIGGAGLGVLGGIVYLVRHEGAGRADLRRLMRDGRAWRIGARLMAMSLPYVMASLALIARRFIDRGYVLTLGDPALLGAYAIVARAAELVGFAFALPGMGFPPLIVARQGQAAAARLARLLYSAYVGASLAAVALVSYLGPLWLARQSAEIDAGIADLLLPILAGTLFLGELSIAGFGYVIAQKPRLYSRLSLAFPVLYLILVLGLSAAGWGLAALGWGFALASFVFSVAAIQGSEVLVRFGYPMVLIWILKGMTLTLALWAMA